MGACLCVAAEVSSLATIRRFVREVAAALGADPTVIPDLVLAVDEVASNIILHGYRGRPGHLEVELERAGHTLLICLRDEAPPFDPTSAPPPDLSRPLMERLPGGLGLYLTRHSVDEMLYRLIPGGGNELTLVKRDTIEEGTPC